MPPNKGGTKAGSRIPRTARNVGSRTGVSVLAGKMIRKDARGMDNFEDYFTEDEEEEDESVLTNVDQSIDKPNASKENGILKKQKSSRRANLKLSTSPRGKEVRKSLQKFVTEVETSDEEDLVTAGNKNGSLTASRIEKLSSSLRGKKRLSFSPSPKLSSASKTSQKGKSPKKPTTSQHNNLEFDSSDEDLFMPVKLDWTLPSKQPAHPVPSINKAAPSPASRFGKASPRLTPQKTTKEATPQKRTPLARRSLPSARDEDYVQKQSMHLHLDETSDEEPVLTPRKSPRNASTPSKSEVLRKRKSLRRQDAVKYGEPEEAAVSESEDGSDSPPDMNPEVRLEAVMLGSAKSLKRDLDAEGWTAPGKAKKVTPMKATPSIRSKSSLTSHRQDDLEVAAALPAKPKSKVPLRIGSKTARRDNEVVEPLSPPKKPQKMPTAREEPDLNGASSTDSDSRQPPMIKKSPRKASMAPELIGIVSEADFKASPPKKSQTKVQKTRTSSSTAPLLREASERHDNSSASSERESASPKKQRAEVPASKTTELKQKSGDEQAAANSYNFRGLPGKSSAARGSPKKRRHQPPRHASDSGREHYSDADTEVAASPTKAARRFEASSRPRLSVPGTAREAVNSSAVTKQHSGPVGSPRRSVASPARITHRPSSDEALSDSETDERPPVHFSGSRKSKRFADAVSPRKEKEVMIAMIDSSDEEYEMADGPLSSPWSKLQESAPKSHARAEMQNKALPATEASSRQSTAKTKNTPPAATGSKKTSEDPSCNDTKVPNRRNGRLKISAQKETAVRRKADVGRKGPKRDTEEAAQEGGNLRRSERHRVPKLERYIGQRIVYKLDANGLPVVDCIAEGSKHTLNAHFRRREKTKKPKKREAAAVQLVEDSFLADEGVDEVQLEDILVINPETNEEVYVDCIRVKKSYVYVGPNGEKVGKDDPMAITKPLEQKAFSSGIIVIRPLQEKGNHYVQHDAMIFWIIRGQVEVTVHQTTVILSEMDSFFVPPGNKYNIKNLTTSSVKLLFFQHKRERLPRNRSQPH